jgi:hypothetical protein
MNLNWSRNYGRIRIRRERWLDALPRLELWRAVLEAPVLMGYNIHDHGL